MPEQWLTEALHSLVRGHGTPGERMPVTLLHAGAVRDTANRTAVLVAATLPSGESVIYLSVFTSSGEVTWSDARRGAASWGGTLAATEPARLGLPLVDQLLALELDGSVTVSGPAEGTTAEVLASDGTVLATMPLGAGAGSTAVRGAPSGVRILDGAGGVVAESALTETIG